LSRQSVFDFGIVLKGGTSLRKFRAGNAGRFSTDLDFATPDADSANLVIDTLDGATHYDVKMQVVNREELRGIIRFDTPLGSPEIPARLELSPRPLWLPTMVEHPVELPVHKGYEFLPAGLPVPAVEEAIAEKLAAWRRRRKIRDLYDLYWFGQGVLDETLVRRVFVLKVWHDVVRDGLGRAPLDPAEVAVDLDTKKLPHEDIGLLTQPVDVPKWLTYVRERYQFVVGLDEDEQRVVKCNPGDDHFVWQLVAALRPPR
jgi:predicted nucleotidyltransferase component of viral defense system